MSDAFEQLFIENDRIAPSDEKQYVSIGALKCEDGSTLPEVTVAYQTWGEFTGDNAVLVCHAVSGDSNAAKWWDALIGPGKAVDTDRYFVIGNNLLGGCQGTTGPASQTRDGKPYGSRFPKITVADMVQVQRRLLKHLQVDHLHCAMGGSMGGFLALEWSTRCPEEVSKVFTSGCVSKANAMQIGFHETARQAILRDPKFRNGDYDPQDPPTDGLALARMLGHLTYLSPESFERKFGRERRADGVFQVASYLQHQAHGFTRRFDANSYLAMSNALDEYEWLGPGSSNVQFLSVGFSSDWFYAPSQTREIHELAQSKGCCSQFEEVDLPFGHDSFLLDGEIQARHLSKFLNPKI